MKSENAPKHLSTISVPRYAWIILGVVYLTGLVAPMARMKVPPVMPILIDAFHLSYTQAGWLMSVFSITGVLLAFPAGLIIQKFGLKKTGLFAVGSLLLGSVLGALSKNASTLLFSRFVEGAGFGLFAVVGPAALTLWFPKKSRGTVMGIWSTFAPVGYLIVLNLVPSIGISISWQAVWWVSAALALIFFTLFGVFFRMPKNEEIKWENPPADDLGKGKGSIWEGLRNRDLWLIGLAFFCFSFAQMGFTTFYPTYLSEILGFSLANASFLVSIQMIVLTAPFLGWISDRIESRKIVFIIGLTAMAFLMIPPFNIVSYGAILTYMVIRGIFEDSTPAMCYASVPEVVKNPQFIGIAMAMMALWQGLGNVFGPPFFGWAIEMTNNWALAGYAMVPVILIGIVVVWFARIR